MAMSKEKFDKLPANVQATLRKQGMAPADDDGAEEKPQHDLDPDAAPEEAPAAKTKATAANVTKGGAAGAADLKAQASTQAPAANTKPNATKGGAAGARGAARPTVDAGASDALADLMVAYAAAVAAGVRVEIKLS